MFMNPPFPRPAEPPIKPQYIVLFKGDDSDFQGNQSVDVVIDTELDTTGMKAHFRFMDFVQDFDSIPENKTLSLVFPNKKTSEFPLGAADATLRFEDASGKFRTISNRIHIVVTNSVHEAYDNEDSQSITVTVKGTVTWDMIEGKPDIPSEFPEPSDNAPQMDGEASAGESTEYSRGDHKHPSDTRKRDIDDFGIRGEPQEAGSWFTVNGETYHYESGIWTNEDSSPFIDITSETYRYQDPNQGIEFVFTLDNGVYTGDGYVIIGYVDTLAEVSQIPSPSSSIPLMDGTASHGSSAAFSRGDHVHPHDAAKLDGAAAYPAWDGTATYLQGDVVWYDGQAWISNVDIIPTEPPEVPGESSAWETCEGTIYGQIASKQDALSSAQMAAVNSGATSAKVATWDGYAAQIAAKANAADVNAALAQKASMTDLPYAMVTPGEWEFSGAPTGYEPTGIAYDDSEGMWILTYIVQGEETDSITAQGTADDLLVVFTMDDENAITATRPSLPGHLCDRANNLIDATTGDVTLTLPAYQDGKVRDLLVHVNLGDDGTDPYTVTVNFPSGETNTGFKVKGNASAPLPAPDAAGEWLYSFSECAPHKMAVSLAQLQDATAAGGS